MRTDHERIGQSVVAERRSVSAIAATNIAYRAAHPIDNTSGAIALRKRIFRA